MRTHRSISLILAIVSFIPILSGILDFYNGKLMKGLLFTITAGLFEVGTILNLIGVLTGSYKFKD